MLLNAICKTIGQFIVAVIIFAIPILTSVSYIKWSSVGYGMIVILFTFLSIGEFILLFINLGKVIDE